MKLQIQVLNSLKNSQFNIHRLFCLRSLFSTINIPFPSPDSKLPIPVQSMRDAVLRWTVLHISVFSVHESLCCVCLLSLSTEGQMPISLQHPWTSKSGWLSPYCQHEKCVCLPAAWREAPAVCSGSAVHDDPNCVICKHCILLNSAHYYYYHYFLAPFSHPVYLCDECFKTCPTFVWETIEEPFKSHSKHQFKH